MYIITNCTGNRNILIGFTGIDNIIVSYRIKCNTGTWWCGIHAVAFIVRDSVTIAGHIGCGDAGRYAGISSKIAASNGYAKGTIFIYLPFYGLTINRQGHRITRLYIITNSTRDSNILIGFTGINNIIRGYRIKGNTGTRWCCIHAVSFRISDSCNITCCIGYGDAGRYADITSKITTGNFYAKSIIC